MSKILVIDDVKMNRDVVALALTSGGHDIIAAADGETGIQLASSEQARPPTEERALDAGCDGFVRKPIVADALLESVREILSKTQRSVA